VRLAVPARTRPVATVRCDRAPPVLLFGDAEIFFSENAKEAVAIRRTVAYASTSSQRHVRLSLSRHLCCIEMRESLASRRPVDVI